jgi:putative redox protein
MDAKVTWKNGMVFDGVANSGFPVTMDTSVQSGGSGSGVSPMELVLIALGGCTSMDVVPILQKKRQEVHAFEIRVHGDRAQEHPHVYTDITLEYVVTGHNVDPAAVERAIELSETKYCSVSAMLQKSVRVTTKYTIIEG